MERISKKRKAKAEKPQFPKLRSKYGVTHSFRFSLRAWFNFKLYAIVFLLLVAAVVTVFVIKSNDETNETNNAVQFGEEKLVDGLYDYIGMDALNTKGAVRMIDGHDVVLLSDDIIDLEPGEECDHNWVKVSDVITVASTCKEAGKRTITLKCSECDVTKTVETELEKLPHTPAEAVKENEKDPTCVDTGSYEEVIYCSACHTELSRTLVAVDPLGHDTKEEAETTPATCTTPGQIVTTATCDRCHTVMSTTTVVLPAEHTAGDPVVSTTDNKCVDGTKTTTVSCTVCAAVISESTEIIPAVHTPGTPVKEYEDKIVCCVEFKHDYVVYCTDCHVEISRETVTVYYPEHTPLPKVNENEVYPTCTTAGSHDEVVYCAVCGDELSREPITDAALGHKYTDCLDTKCDVCGDERVALEHVWNYAYVEDYKAPTCTETGYVVYRTTCDLCGAQKDADPKKEIPLLPHTPNGEATCTEASVCTDCGTELEAALGHTPNSEATCTEASVCTVCGTELEAALGHTPNGEATCTEASVCTVCGTELKAALGHERENPTCLESTTCERCGDVAKAKGHTYTKCSSELKCEVCGSFVNTHRDVSKKDYKCDDCGVKLRTINFVAVIYTICVVAIVVLAAWFIILTVMLVVTALKVSTMRLDFYDDVMVWRWGRVFKRHIEQRFIGVYDVLAMPRNKLYYKESKESKKPAKYGTVLAKVPGGGYEWNRKFFGVKEYVQLVNYLKSKKIGEGSVVLEHDTGVKFKG